MEAPNGYNGEDIIGDIYRARKAIYVAERGVGNADFRIVNDGSRIDKMWIDIKNEKLKEYEKAMEHFENLYQKVISSKNQSSKEEYNLLLKKLGIVLGMTENISHVEDNLYDERDLQQALDETSDMIKQKREELKTAAENGEEDLVIILSSEIEYYENDMKKHYWGESRLEILNSDIKKSK